MNNRTWKSFHVLSSPRSTSLWHKCTFNIFLNQSDQIFYSGLVWPLNEKKLPRKEFKFGPQSVLNFWIWKSSFYIFISLKNRPWKSKKKLRRFENFLGLTKCRPHHLLHLLRRLLSVAVRRHLEEQLRGDGRSVPAAPVAVDDHGRGLVVAKQRISNKCHQYPDKNNSEIVQSCNNENFN